MKTNVKETSLNAYDDLKGDDQLGKMQKRIIDVMKPNISYTRKELSRLSNMETSSVSGRVNELIGFGYIEVIGKQRCSITNKTVESLRKVQEII